MKKPFRFLAVIIGLLLLGAFFYWQLNKKNIVEKAVQSSVSKKTDSLYYIKYDSSAIDAVSGNASFYNVVLQSDSVQQRIAADDTSNNIMYRVRVAEIAIKGADVAGLLTGSNLQARLIEIIEPDVQMTRIGNQADQPFTRDDSLALYEKILGKFKSIQAGEIVIRGGDIRLSKRNDPPNTILENINISIKNFRVDSTKDYENLLSYFLKGIVANVGKVSFHEPGKDLIFNDVVYDAANRFIRIRQFQQKNNSGRVVSDLKNLSIDGLSTNAFIADQKLIAGELSTDGGMITVYKRKGAKKENNIELDSSFFDKAVLEKISIGKTKVLVYDRAEPAAAPLIINNVEFYATDIPVVRSGNTLKNIIANSQWILSGDGLSYNTSNKVYKISIGPFQFNTAKSLISLRSLTVKPLMTEAAFVRSLKVQKDYVDLAFNNIVATGADIKNLVAERTLSAENVSLQPLIKIFNDRTVPRNPESKVPTDPARFIKGIENPIKINTVRLNNGYISYKERGRLSAKTGQLFFDRFNAVLTNVTNIPAAINNKPELILNANTKFMGVSTFTTRWVIALNSATGDFKMNGKLGPVEGTVLNTALEPQAMLSVKRGSVTSFDFNSTGNEKGVHTASTLLYKDLKVELLEKDPEKKELDKKNVTSILANIIIRDENPKNGKVRKNEVDYPRDITRSFFYLVSQSFFLSIRKTITGKNNAN